jgi:deoxyribose-phosphate aldolase
MSDEELRLGCEIAANYRVASVCIKPYAVPDAAEWLKNSEVEVGTVVGFPHGANEKSIKVEETRKACSEGATEIDMVVNIGKVLSEEWHYVGDEINAVTQEVHRHNAIIKVIFENDFLNEDHLKKKLCEICGEIGVDFVKTSTGYGFVKGPDGAYRYRGATDDDLKLMRKHSPESVKVKAAGGVRTLDDVLRVRELGVSRVGATATKAILEEAKERFG